MKHKKRLLGRMLGVSPKKIKFQQEALAEVQKAITRSDMRGLLAVHKIEVQRPSQQSRTGARQRRRQKRKGLQKGHGSRKKGPRARVSKKDRWKARVRALRAFLKSLREKGALTPQNYRLLYTKSKGGYFRNLRHLKLYLQEQQLTQKTIKTTPEGKKNETA